MLTRRDFVTQLAVAGAAIGAFALAPEAAWLADAPARSVEGQKPVISFHMDRPYIDRSGTAMPYQPPLGTRSGESAAGLSEEAFRRMQCYA